MLNIIMFKTRQPINGTAYVLSFIKTLENGYRQTKLEEDAVWNLDVRDINLVLATTIREEINDTASALKLDIYIIFISLVITILMSLAAIVITVYILTVFRWVKSMTATLRIRYSFAIANLLKVLLASSAGAVILYNVTILFIDNDSPNIYAMYIYVMYIRIDKKIGIINVLNAIRMFFSEVLFYHLILLSIHDFILIIFSLKYKYVFVNHNANAALAAVWLIPFVKELLLHFVNFPPLLFDLVTLCFPSVVVSYMYTHILVFIRSQRAKWVSLEEGGHTFRNCGGETLKNLNSYVKAIHTTLYMLAVFVIFRLIGYLITICLMFIKIPYDLAFLKTVLLMLAFVSEGIVDSVFYLTRVREIVNARKEMNKDLRKIFC